MAVSTTIIARRPRFDLSGRLGQSGPGGASDRAGGRLERNDVERRVLHAMGRASAATGMAGAARSASSSGGSGGAIRGVPESIAAALANVNAYTLFDPRLASDGADVPAFVPALDPEAAAW